MSKQRFSGTFRESLWEVHNRKCLFRDHGKLFEDIVVDHVVPETLLDDSARFAAVIESHGLNADFNIRGLYNLAPACYSCNQSKLDLILPVGQLGIILSRVEAKVPELEKLVAQQKTAKALDNIIREITRSVDKDVFTKDEFTAAARRNGFGDFAVLIPRGHPQVVPLAPSHNFQFEAGNVYITEHARERMKQRGLAFADVVKALELGHLVATAREIEGRNRYTVITDNNLVVVYEFRAEKCVILTSF